MVSFQAPSRHSISIHERDGRSSTPPRFPACAQKFRGLDCIAVSSKSLSFAHRAGRSGAPLHRTPAFTRRVETTRTRHEPHCKVPRYRARVRAARVVRPDTSTIRWGIDPTYPPFEAKQPDGSLAGFDIDLRNAICEQLHAKCVWVEQGFDGMIPAARAQVRRDHVRDDGYRRAAQADRLLEQAVCIAGCARRAGRLDAAADRRVARGQARRDRPGTTQEAYAKAEWATKGVTIVSYQNRKVYQDLVNGRLDATFQDKTQAGYSFLKTPRGRATRSRPT